MSLSDRWKIDSRTKGELDDIRRSIEQRHGLSTDNGPPMGAGRGVLSYERFSREDLKSIRVDVGPRPGERRVYSSSGRSSQSSTSSDMSVETCILAGSGDHWSEDKNMHISVKPNARGEQVRTVVVQNVVAHPPEQMCILCRAHSELLCPVCKTFYCSSECQLKDWPAHKEFCKPKGLLPSTKEKVPEKDKGPSSPRPSDQKSCPEKEKGRFAAKQGGQRNNAYPVGGTEDKMQGKPGQAELPRKYQEKSPSQPPNRTRTSALLQSPDPKSAPVHQKTDMPLSGCQPKLATLPLGEPIEVAFSFGTSLSEFYLQSFIQMPQLAELQAGLQALCADSSGAHSPAKGEICAALFKDDGQWYRARVDAVGPVCMVYFIDYGNVAPVDSGNTHPLPESHLQLPAQAVRCRLHGVRPVSSAVGWAMEATAMLATMFQAGPVVASVLRMVEDMHEVELTSKRNGLSLNQQLVAKGLAAALKATASPVATSTAAPAREPGMVPQRQSERMRTVLDLVKVGDKLRMAVTVSAKDVVWCLALMPDFAAPLVEVEKALHNEAAEFGGKSRAHELTAGDYVASKSTEDGHWYRAYISKKTANKHTVRYVDYGNDESNTTIFPLASKHKEVPAAAVRLLTSDPTSFRTGQLFTFTVESVDGGTARGTASSEEDGKSTAGLGLVPWHADLISDVPGKTSSSSPSAPRTPTEPALSKPVPSKPATSKPVTSKPVTSKPVSSKPVLSKPVSSKPVTSKPVPRIPTAAEPVSTSAQPAAALQSNMDAKVLHVPQRKLPSDKTDMALVWKTPDGLFLQQQSLAEELQAMMGALNAWVKSHSPEPASTIKYSKGDYVCALFSEDCIWYRGQVLSEQSLEGTYLVLFIDFGNEERLPASSLRPLPPSFAEKPLFVFCVVPKNVPTENSRLAILLQQEPFAAVQVGTTQAGLPLVQLERKDGTCLNDLISRAPHKAPKKTYLERPLPTERTKAVITHVADVGGLVYLQQCSLSSELQAMMSELNSSVPTAPLSALSVGDVACARYPADQLWYRVCVLSTPEGGKCKVSFVDFGNDDFVPLPDIRALPQKMINIQLFANSVALQGVKTVSKDSASQLLYTEVEFAVVDSSSQPCKVKLFAGDQCLNDLIE